MPEPTDGRGRPRDRALDDAILEATLGQLATQGYEGTSIAEVAAAAGTTRPTIYRRWSDKAALATAAVAHLERGRLPPRTGDHRQDLVTLLEHVQQDVEAVNEGALAAAFLVEEERNPSLAQAFRGQVLTPRRERIETILRDARDDGALRDGADLGAAAGLLSTAAHGRHLEVGELDADWAERVVDAVWAGLAAPSLVDTGAL